MNKLHTNFDGFLGKTMLRNKLDSTAMQGNSFFLAIFLSCCCNCNIVLNTAHTTKTLEINKIIINGKHVK